MRGLVLPAGYLAGLYVEEGRPPFGFQGEGGSRVVGFITTSIGAGGYAGGRLRRVAGLRDAGGGDRFRGVGASGFPL